MARLRMLWANARDSLWLLPSALTVLATALAFALTSAERAGWPGVNAESSLVFAGGVEGARGVLNAIAGGLITVTGVVFSITIVALQLASSQFTPRVLRTFMADRANQMVLGVFIGTFTYTVLVLRTIQSKTLDADLFIPRVSVTLAVAFVLVSMGFLIFFINHAARSIQVVTILDRVTRETLRQVDRLFPEPIGRPDPRPGSDESAGDAAASVTAAVAGYLQAVDAAALFELGRERSLVVRMTPHIGDFVLPGESLASLSPASAVDDAVVAAVRAAFVLGSERTPEQDIEFGIIEIADIAVRALSPGINDPTTALHCIDRLGEILLAIGTHEPIADRRTREGRVHFVSRYTTLERATALAFDQIRHSGAQNPVVANKLLAMLTRLESLVPTARAVPLRAAADALLASAQHGIDDPSDTRSFEGARERAAPG